jgi:hypothetical protein
VDYKIRAIIARIGLTANAPKEAVYFSELPLEKEAMSNICQAKQRLW